MISKIEGYEIALSEAFKLAKQQKRSPIEIAKELSKDLLKEDWVDKAISINGYVNIKLSIQGYIKKLGSIPNVEKKRIAIEYVSVNPNKPWHIGHLRNALIGQTLVNLYRFLGHHVFAIDYIDDLGLQVAQSYWHYKKYGLKPHKRKDWAVGLAYIEASQLFNEHEEEIRKILKEMEDKGIARAFAESILMDQLLTAKSYGIKHDMRVFESDIARLLPESLEYLKRFITYHTEGELKGTWTTKNNRVIIRSNGTATYLGKDIVFQLWKLGKGKIYFEKRQDPTGEVWYSSHKGIDINVNADKIINVIGIEQSLPQSEIANLIKQLFPKKEYIHVGYQRVRLKDKVFSGRKGTWVGYTADELLKEGIEKIGNKKLALAAIKFFILKHNPSKEVIFDWNKALSTEGDSGIYVMYSYVRAQSVLKKSSEIPKLEHIEDQDRELGKWLIAFSEYVTKAYQYNDPSALTDYALLLSAAFNSYYAKVRIADNPNRLFFTAWTKNILEKTLNLLGIDVVEEM